MIKLRTTQEKSIRDLAIGIKNGHKRQVLMSATGTGKTTIAAEIIRRAVEKGKRVWFTVDTLELVEQAAEKFEEFGLDVSIVQGINDKTDYRKPVQVMTNQTLKGRWMIFDVNPQWLPDLIFHDECHVRYKAHYQIDNMLPHVPCIGLSATPFSKGLGKLYSNLVIGETTRDAIDMGHLCDYEAYAPFVPDMKGVKVSGGDYVASHAAARVNSKQVVGDIVENWMDKAHGKSTLVFACNIAHSESIVREFQSKGVNAAHLDGYTDKDERQQVIKDFKSGKITVLSSVMVLTKGFDAPNAEICILAAPTKSLMKHIQMLGRVLRVHDSKQHAMIFDHAGNLLRLGFPTDLLPDYLSTDDKEEATVDEKKKKENKEKEPEICPKCGHFPETWSFVCPKCHYKPVIEHGVEKVDGKLEKVKKANDTIPPEVKHEWYQMLTGYAAKKGYKRGWASWKYKEKFGHFPHGDATPMEPNTEVMNYITHLNIKRAKRRVA